MDLNRVLGALLGGAAQPPRRRRSTSSLGRFGAGLIGTGRATSMEAKLGRAVGAAAAAAIEGLLSRRGAAAPPPEPPAAARGAGRALPERGAAPAPAGAGRPWAGPAPAPARGAGMPWRGAAPPAPPAAGPSAEEAEALLLVRAMVAAAASDGAVDAAERGAIAAQLDAAGLTAEERDFVLADFDRPLAPEALAREATDPMLRARLYAAAVAGAGQVTPGERAFLDALARALRLDKAAAAAIEERLAG